MWKLRGVDGRGFVDAEAGARTEGQLAMIIDGPLRCQDYSWRAGVNERPYAALWKSSIWRIQLVSGFHLGKSGPPSFAHESGEGCRAVASQSDAKAGLSCPLTSFGSASHAKDA